MVMQIKDKQESGKRQRSDKDENSDGLRESKQKQSSLEITVVSQIQSLNEAVRSSEKISKELDVINSEIVQKEENLILESD